MQCTQLYSVRADEIGGTADMLGQGTAEKKKMVAPLPFRRDLTSHAYELRREAICGHPTKERMPLTGPPEPVQERMLCCNRPLLRYHAQQAALLDTHQDTTLCVGYGVCL